jgi:hypothetical protein
VRSRMVGDGVLLLALGIIEGEVCGSGWWALNRGAGSLHFPRSRFIFNILAALGC